MSQWVTADALATHLDLPANGPHEAAMDEACVVAQAWITTRVLPELNDTDTPPPELVLATKYQAAKLFRRRQTPEGIAMAGDFGPMRVMGTDPDVEALIRAYRYDGFGPSPTITGSEEATALPRLFS